MSGPTLHSWRLIKNGEDDADGATRGVAISVAEEVLADIAADFGNAGGVVDAVVVAAFRRSSALPQQAGVRKWCVATGSNRGRR